MPARLRLASPAEVTAALAASPRTEEQTRLLVKHFMAVLEGRAPVAPLPVPLAEASLRRGLHALTAGSYNSPLAVRCLVETAGNRDLPQWQRLWSALAGS